jgi:regulator of sirC expression with transglutaminase-like and TPR domain
MLKSKTPAIRTADCPDEGGWGELVAGLAASEDTGRLLQHASQCGYCGPILRETIAAFHDPVTDEEQQILEGLNSAGTEWQRNLAQQMEAAYSPSPLPDHESGPSRRTWLEKLSPWRLWQQREPGPEGLTIYAAIEQPWWKRTLTARRVWAAAMAMVVAVVGWGGYRALNPSVDHLLAEAYTAKRISPLRFPGAAYAPMSSVQRGAGAELPTFEQPQPLLEAHALISRELQKHPDDPRWLRAEAQAELQAGRYEAAIEILQPLQQTSAETPEVLRDLAAAYFQRAEASPDRAADYQTAADLLSQALAKSPADAVMLYNRAIVYERLSLYHQALADWEQYLQSDPTGAWADDARRHRDEIKSKLQQHDRGMALPWTDPGTFNQHVKLTDEGTWDVVDARVEDYMVQALEHWLPQAFPKSDEAAGRRAEAETAVATMAAILERRHGDLWLNDLRAARQEPAMAEGIAELGAAVQANLAGNASAGLAAARRAMNDFRAAGSRAGWMRAGAEATYGLHRTFTLRACIAQADELQRQPENQRYPWIASRLWLEQYNCRSYLSQLGAAQRAVDKGLSAAREARYRVEEMRAIGFEASAANDDERPAKASQWDRVGLGVYWSGSPSPLRAYQFYDDLSNASAHRSLRYEALAEQREAVWAVGLGGNNSVLPAARVQHAKVALRAQQRDEAAAEIRTAIEEFDGLPQDGLTRGLWTEAQADLATLEVESGQMDAAARRLAAIRERVPDLQTADTALVYYPALARVLRGANDLGQAEAALQTAVNVSERRLASLQNEDERANEAAGLDGIYREYVSLLVAQHRDAESLAFWEWFRAARFHDRGKPDNWQDVRTDVLGGPRDSSAGPRRTSLIYAELADGVVVWAVNGTGVRLERIPAGAAEVNRLAHSFARDCGAPGSSLQRLREKGQRLYSLLIGPVASAVSEQSLLVIEPDGPMGKFRLKLWWTSRADSWA